MSRRVSSVSLDGARGAVQVSAHVVARVLALLAVGVPLATLGAACQATDEAPRVSIATDLVLPRGVLDRVVKLTLTVTEGNVTCDATAGQTALPGGPSAATEIAKRDLATTGCAAGVKFCGDVAIEKSDAPRVFSAVAKGADDATLAIGCAQVTVNQDALPLAIKMFRYLAPPVCGDSVVQPTEQCEPGNTFVCDASCLSKELLLSVGATQTGTKDGKPGDKSDIALLWPAGTAAGTQGRFFAFYTDRAVAGSNNFEVSLRAMTADLSPIPASESPALAAGSLYLPNDPAVFPPVPAPRQQSFPSAAFLNGKYYVAFQDDTGTSTGLDIHLRSMDSALVAEQGPNNPLGINGPSGAGEDAIQGVPSIAAGPGDHLFIAWEDAGQGKIAGRTLAPPSTLGNQNDLSTGTGNKGVSVAATPTGWVAVWQSGTGVKLRVVNQDGTPQGSEQAVNDSGTVSERPRVASLSDGRFAVTWNAGGDIFVQRYDAKGAKIAGDQATAINDVVKDGEQVTPSIAGTAAAGGSYAVVWLDANSSHIRGRMLGGSSGFLFNNVTGQSSEYQASRVDGHPRANPAVVAGGSGPFIAVAWEDKSTTGPGIVARRFPLPSE
jgi:hypothetical protein